jgi:hypothetical protein
MDARCTLTIGKGTIQGKLVAKKFKSGSQGFQLVDKLDSEIDGKRYQLNVLAIEIGSKPAAPAAS